jgi:hypothetical protein
MVRRFAWPRKRRSIELIGGEVTARVKAGKDTHIIDETCVKSPRPMLEENERSF